MTAQARLQLVGLPEERAPSRQEPDLRRALALRPELAEQYPAAVRAAIALAQEYDALRRQPGKGTSRVYILAEYRRHLADLGLTPGAGRSADPTDAALADLIGAGPDPT